jgi:hypothetical protein
MSKSKNKHKAIVPERAPVMQGDCFATFLREAQSIGNEVVARRAYDADVGEYLAEKGLLEDFAAWREAKPQPR